MTSRPDPATAPRPRRTIRQTPVVNTLLPADAELPVNLAATADAIVLGTRKAVVSNLFRGGAARVSVVSVTVPALVKSRTPIENLVRVLRAHMADARQQKSQEPT